MWKVERFEDFLAARRRLIAEGINAFMASLLEGETGDVTTSIEDSLASGEGPQIEFKSSLRWDYKEGNANKGRVKDVLKAIAAFLNKDGGSLLIGVADDGTVLGIEADFKTLGAKANSDGWEQALRSAIRDQLGGEFNPAVEVTFSQLQGKTVAMVSCAAHHKPVFLEDGNQSAFYVRSGASSQLLDVKAAAAYISKRFSAAA